MATTPQTADSPVIARGGLASLGVTAILAASAAPGTAAADGLADLPTTRSVGRAGTGLVSDDGAGAVLLAPAGLARRDVARGQVGALVVDHDLTFDADEEAIVPGTSATPVIADRTAPAVAPWVSGQLAVGPIVVGAAYATTADRQRHLPVPTLGQPNADVIKLFPHRYGGLSSSVERRTLAAAAAWRATDWLAIGGALAASRVDFAERRHVWAAYPDRGDPEDSATRDVDLRLEGADPFVPAVAVSALLAPPSAPLELAIAVSWSADAHIDGTARAALYGDVEEVMVTSATGPARVHLAAPLGVRAGVRWLGARWAAELGADLWIARNGVDLPRWDVGELEVRDKTLQTAAIDHVPSRLAQHSHGALRGAVDAELLEGFVWLTGGWAWSGAAMPRDRMTPVFADLGGHTAALGVEITAGGVTITGGWSRTFTASRWTRGAAMRDNPFDAGTVPASAGRYDTARDAVGVGVELALD